MPRPAEPYRPAGDELAYIVHTHDDSAAVLLRTPHRSREFEAHELDGPYSTTAEGAASGAVAHSYRQPARMVVRRVTIHRMARPPHSGSANRIPRLAGGDGAPGSIRRMSLWSSSPVMVGVKSRQRRTGGSFPSRRRMRMPPNSFSGA